MKTILSREELATLLGLRVQTLAAWACRGRGPRFRVRRRRAICSAADVASWLADPVGHERAVWGRA
jgi:hypothetical protein